MDKLTREDHQARLARWETLQTRIGLSDRTEKQFFVCMRWIRFHRMALVVPYQSNK